MAATEIFPCRKKALAAHCLDLNCSVKMRAGPENELKCLHAAMDSFFKHFPFATCFAACFWKGSMRCPRDYKSSRSLYGANF